MTKKTKIGAFGHPIYGKGFAKIYSNNNNCNMKKPDKTYPLSVVADLVKQTDMTQIEKIRQEIERRKEEYKKDRYMSDYRGQIAYYKDEIYDDLLSFIDSLQQEQPCEELKGEIREWVNLMVGASFPEQDGDYISEEDYRSVIRQTALHFYELGKNSK